MASCVSRQNFHSHSPWPTLHTGHAPGPDGGAYWCEGQDCSGASFGSCSDADRYNQMKRAGRFSGAPAPNRYVPTGEEFDIHDHVLTACCARWDHYALSSPYENLGPDTFCYHMRQELCEHGYEVGLLFIPAYTCWDDFGNKESHHGPFLCRYNRGYPGGIDDTPGDVWGTIRPTPPPASTKFHGTDTVCQCTNTGPPFLPPEYLAAGLTGCVLGSGQVDQRSWEEACAIPFDDETECIGDLGFPVSINRFDGTAFFYGGLRKVDSSSTGCKQVISDPAIYSDGTVRPIACLTFEEDDTVRTFGKGAIAQPDCAAAYMDINHDAGFQC